MSGELQTNKEKWVPAPYDDPERFIVDAQGVKAKFVLWVSAYECQCRFDFICSPIHVVSYTRDSDTGVYGKLLQIVDDEGKIEEWVMPSSALFEKKGEGVLSKLVSMGVHIPQMSLAPLVLEYLSWSKPSEKITCVDKTGWNGELFVLPDIIIGDTAGQKVVFKDTGKPYHYGTKGSLSEWNEHVGKYAEGNSRLVLATVAGIVGPMLRLCNKKSSGVHLYGASSSGKTTCLEVCVSTKGGPDGIISWRATDNAMENIAVAHNDSTIATDEVSQGTAHSVSSTNYMLANEQGKARANRSGDLRKVQTWRLFQLSSGELTLDEKLSEEGGKGQTAGQSVRLVSFRADTCTYGVFDDLKGFRTGSEFANHLKTAVKDYYGTPFIAFVESVVGRKEEIAAKIAAMEKAFAVEFLPDTESVDGQVSRVLSAFIFLAAVGEVAIEHGVLSWAQGSAKEGVKRCFNDWIAERGGTGSLEGSIIKQGLIDFITANIDVRIFNSTTLRAEINKYNRPRFGTYVLNDNGKSPTSYFILPQYFKEEICKKAKVNSEVAYAVLRAQGILIPGNDGKSTINKKFHGSKETTRHLHFKLSIGD